MATHKQQDEGVVLFGFTLSIDGRSQLVHLHGRDGLALPAGQFTAHVVRHAAKGDLYQPGPWIAGKALKRPLRGSRYQGLLNGVLRGGEVPKTADHHAEYLRREIAQQVLSSDVQQLVRHGSSSVLACMICRTSMGMLNGTPPGPGPADNRAAISYARCGPSTSTIQ